MCALLALASPWIIGQPDLVSPIHTCLVFVLGTFAWVYFSFSSIRNSYGAYVFAIILAFLTLSAGFFPDYWLRWPEALILGLGLSQLGAAIFFQAFSRHPKLRLQAGFLVSGIAIGPLAIIPYLNSPEIISAAGMIAGGILLVFGLIHAWLSRHKRINIMNIFSWLFVILLVAALVTAHYTNFLDTLQNQAIFEQALLFTLLFLASLYIIDILQVEHQLRSGPHMDLDTSFKDSLTRLANRRALETYGPEIIQRSHDAGRAVSVIVADIDHFKTINDTHGHPMGDVVLQKTAEKLLAHVRKSDLVSRYGGEEFVIILPGSPLAPALRLAERIRASIQSDIIHHNGVSLRRTLSFGVATAFPEDAATLPQLIQKADTNLYRAKHAGRNRVMSDALPPQLI